MESNQHATYEASSLDSSTTSRRFADTGRYLVEVVDAVVAQASNRTTSTSTGYVTTEVEQLTTATDNDAFEALRMAAVHQRAVDLISEMCVENAAYVRSAGRLTVVTSTVPDTQGKRLSKAPDGSIRKEQPDNLREGVARLAFFEDANDLIDILAELTDADAISPQVPKTDVHPVRLATLKAAATDPYAHTRSKANFEPNTGRGVIVVDYDPGTEALSRQELVNRVLGLVPGLQEAGVVWAASSSSHIFDGEREVIGLRGQRLYVLAEDASEAGRVLSVLNKHAWLAGLGHIEISKAGSLLVRGIADEAMATAARLDYAGGCVCEPPLSQRRPRPEVINFDSFVDTRTVVPDLTDKEEKRYLALVAKAKQDAEPEAKVIRDARAKAKRDEVTSSLVETGVPEPEARRRAAAVVAGMSKGELSGDFVVTLGDGRRVSVAEILADKALYDGETCLDPVEPEYRDGKIVGHLNLSDREANIFSHAHGGRKYLLSEKPSRVAELAAASGLEPGALLFEGERGKVSALAPSQQANVVAQAFVGRYGFEPSTDSWYGWTGTHWSLDGEGSVVARAVHAALEAGLSPLGFAAAAPGGVVQLLQSGGRLDLNLDRSGRHLPFQNGVLDLGTKVLQPHSPEAGLSWSLPYAYEPEADCPTIKQWLSTALGGDASLVEFVRAAAAAILTGRYDLQVFFYLKGKAGTGKGAFLRLITALMGDQNVHHTSLKALESDQFESSALHGKRLAVIADASRHGGSVETLKNMTGGDRLRLRRPFKAPSTFVFEGCVLVASNEELVTSDPSSALARRRRNIRFERKATDVERMDWSQRGGEERVLHQEMPGFVNWLLGLSRDEVTAAIRNPPQAVIDANDEAESANNHIVRWLKERCVVEPGHVAPWGSATVRNTAHLYPTFIEFCEGERVQPLSLNRFKAVLIESCATLGWSVEVGNKHRDRRGLFGVRGLAVRLPSDLGDFSETEVH